MARMRCICTKHTKLFVRFRKAMKNGLILYKNMIRIMDGVGGSPRHPSESFSIRYHTFVYRNYIIMANLDLYKI